jgi:sugar/nucleoside kinase (ribokinase family)
VDVVGVGENATDTIIRLPRFPAFNTSTRIHTARVLPGGQVATAMVACQNWGLRTRYFGKIGDDPAGALQIAEMRRCGVEAHWSTVRQCTSQAAYILVDDSTGERTILFERDERLSHTLEELPREAIVAARVLHLDGHNAAVHATVAGWARAAGIPVVADMDTLYPGHEGLLAAVDYLAGSHDLAERLTGRPSHLEALPMVASKYGNRLVAGTLGRDGVVAFEPLTQTFSYCPAFAIAPSDTTGAGDVFHAGLVYGVTQGWPLGRTLDFSCAAAALNCLAEGARGGIRSFEETERFRLTAPRRSPQGCFAQYNVLAR